MVYQKHGINYAPNLEDFLDYYEGKDITPDQPSSTKNDRKNKLVKAIEAQLAKDARESYFRERPSERAEFNEQQQISFQEALIEREPNVPGEFTPESTAYKAIFMVGSPGGGKTNVGKGLQLGRRGYKVVNQDIALEALKKAAGLPENESNYTKEQRSLRSKLGSQAVKAGKDKFQQYKNEGKGFLIDGTGASYNATTKKIKELEDAGYEVYLVAAMTPKDVAIERNKAREERSLPTFVVSKSYDQVVESLAKYKEDYGDRVFEIDTTTIGFGEALPQDFLNEVYNGITQTKVKQIPATNPIIAFQEAVDEITTGNINAIPEAPQGDLEGQLNDFRDLAEALGLGRLDRTSSELRERTHKGLMNLAEQGRLSLEALDWFKMGQRGRKKVDGKRVDIPAGGGIYFNQTDPKYIDLKNAIIKSNSKPNTKIKPLAVTPEAATKGTKAHIENQKRQAQNDKAFSEFIGFIDEIMQEDPELAAILIHDASAATDGIIKVVAPLRYTTKNLEFGTKGTKYGSDYKKNSVRNWRDEHTMTASTVANYIGIGAKKAKGGARSILPLIKKQYFRTLLSLKYDEIVEKGGFASTMQKTFRLVYSNTLGRYFNDNTNSIMGGMDPH